MIEAVVDSVGDRAVGKQGGKAASASYYEIVGASDIKEAVMHKLRILEGPTHRVS